MTSRPRRGRRLSEEERELWRGIARSIKPLRRTKPAIAEDTAVTSPLAVESIAASPAPPQRVSPPKALAVKASPPSPPPLAPLGRRDKQKLARGRESIDARLDLHGMTQAEAHAALFRFLLRSQADGAKYVLVVTGKGGRGDDTGGRGVLRRQVPHWLRLPEFRGLILSFEAAHVGHGGEGALYVRMRRAR